MKPDLRRRELLGLGVGGVVAVSLGAAFWEDLFGSAEKKLLRPGTGYGPRGRPDANGLRLPAGFSSRRIAVGGEAVAGTPYRWHLASDGSAAFRAAAGGFVLVSNAESFRGGASAIRFSREGNIMDAYRVLEGTTQNCSGGGTPWGTWLSCEEVESGQVWECDPSGRRTATAHPAMGRFKHEAAAVDSRNKVVYLTEDLEEGGLYRFRPETWPRLSTGRLEVAEVLSGRVSWRAVRDPSAKRVPTRQQVPGMTRFRRGEGLWLDGQTLYVATTGDHRVHALDTRRGQIEVIYDGLAKRSAPLLRVDQLTANRAGEVFVCEDLGTNEIDIGLISPQRKASRFLTATGAEHAGSELTGVCFDPSGSRMYFASQRAHGGVGAIYEVRGPFQGRQA